MGGVDVGLGGGKRRSLDSEINMIPMIDLLMVTISFLLITAVWTHMARVDMDAQVPGHPPEVLPPPSIPEKQLHVEMRGLGKFVLQWRQGRTVVDSVDVPRNEVIARQGSVEVVRFPDLVDRIVAEWKAKGQHSSPGDPKLDEAVLHTDDTTEFKYIVGVLDALHAAHRDIRIGTRTEHLPAFNVAFATD
jgi:biopolymer transport protein ExbD